MTEPPAPQRRRILLHLFLSFCVFAVVGFGALSWYITTDSFQQRMRRRVVSSIEKIVGGRVELGELHTIPFRLRVDARNLTIHGSEAPDQLPFLTVDRVQAEMKIISLLSTTIGLHSLVLVHPVIHIMDYPDGTTNAPTPQAKHFSGVGPLEELISLSVASVEVQSGELLWQEKWLPFEFAARDLALRSSYSLLRRQYEAHVMLGSVKTQFQPYPSFSWSLDGNLVLARGHAEISNLTITSGKSDIHFRGRVVDFHNPHVSGDYHGVADMGELGALFRQSQLRKGTAQYDGNGSWSLQSFATQGTVQAKEVEWTDARLSMRNARVVTGFALTPDRFRLSSIRANLFGGELTGDADVTNWQTSFESKQPVARRRTIGRISSGNLQRGTLRLKVARFPLPPVMQLMSSGRLPLDQMNLSGNSSGEVEMLWVGSIRDADTRLKLDVTPPEKYAPEEVPVRGSVEGTYRGSRDEVELKTLHLSTTGSEIIAAGSLAANSASSQTLKFSVTSHNLREWKPLIDAAYGSHDVPFAIRGWATFAGNATGKISALAVSGNLEVYDFSTTLPLRISDRGSVKALHWDALSSTIQYSSNHLAARSGSLVHGHSTAHFEASATLVGGTFPKDVPFTLHVDLHNADAAEILQSAGLDQPITGNLNLTATLSGTRANPHGDGHLDLHNGVAYGVMVPLLKSDLRLAGEDLQLNNIDASAYGAPLSGSVSLNISTLLMPGPTGTNFDTASSAWRKSEFLVNLSGRNLALSRFSRLQTTRFAADGVVDFSLRVRGTVEQPSVEGHVHLKDLALDKESIGDFYVDATTRGRQLDLKAHSEFDKSDLTIQGSVGLGHEFPSNLNLAFHHLDADALLRAYFPGKITGHSPLEGTLHVSGPLRSPRDLKGEAELQAFSVSVGHVQIQSVDTIRLEIANQVLLLKDVHLAGSGTDFTAQGNAHLAGAKELNIRLDGSVNMGLWQALNPKISARGMIGINLNASGTISQPVLQGRLEVKNTFVSHNDFPSGLSDLNGVLLFDRNRIQIESLTGTTGGGSIALTGSATYQKGVYQLDLGATAHGVRLRYPPGVSSTANAELRLIGNTNSAVLSGDVVVTKLAVTPGFDFGAYIERSRQTTVLTETESLQSRLKLDVHVVTTPELQMQTAVARLSGDADLRVRGTAERPAILGRVEVLEGEVTFNGAKYKLDRGDVTFANPAKTQPVIDLQATTRVRDYDITVQFRGDASVANGLKVTWQSEPQLPQADVIALLALGRTQEESAAAGTSGSFGFGGDASNLLINEALNSTVNSRLQKLFGVSRVKIDPQGLANETSVVRGPQVTVEQQVANNLTLTYSTNVAVSNQQIIQVEYNITRNVSIVALRDWNGVVSFDFKIRRRKK